MRPSLHETEEPVWFEKTRIARCLVNPRTVSAGRNHPRNRWSWSVFHPVICAICETGSPTSNRLWTASSLVSESRLESFQTCLKRQRASNSTLFSREFGDEFQFLCAKILWWPELILSAKFPEKWSFNSRLAYVSKNGQFDRNRSDSRTWTEPNDHSGIIHSYIRE
jgi:hypothetical protein